MSVDVHRAYSVIFISSECFVRYRHRGARGLELVLARRFVEELQWRHLYSSHSPSHMPGLGEKLRQNKSRHDYVQPHLSNCLLNGKHELSPNTTVPNQVKLKIVVDTRWAPLLLAHYYLV